MNAILARIRDGNDDDRLDQLRGDQALRRFIRAPFHAAERRRRIENILPVVKIQNRIAATPGTTVTYWKINEHVATVPQNFRGKIRMLLDVSSQSVRHLAGRYDRRDTRCPETADAFDLAGRKTVG
jgi:hypothetical protein